MVQPTAFDGGGLAGSTMAHEEGRLRAVDVTAHTNGLSPRYDALRRGEAADLVVVVEPEQALDVVAALGLDPVDVADGGARRNAQSDGVGVLRAGRGHDLGIGLHTPVEGDHDWPKNEICSPAGTLEIVYLNVLPGRPE